MPMPVNRRGQPEAEKRAQLIAAARELFSQKGYESTAMTHIAKQAKVTPNTIYWYFKDKDELLITVLDQLMTESLSDLAEISSAPLAQQLYWLVGQLRSVSGFVSTVHNRIGVSESVARWHSRFHELIEGVFLMPALGSNTGQELMAEVQIISFALEGIISHQLDEKQTQQVCEALANRLQLTRLD